MSNILNGLLTDSFEEVRVEKTETHIKSYCKRIKRKTWVEEEREFNEVCDKIKEEFGENLMEIYAWNGVDTGGEFSVYLRIN
jgi:hypothetical protein